MAITIKNEALFYINETPYNYENLFKLIKSSTYMEIGKLDFNIFKGVDALTNQKAAILIFESSDFKEDLLTDLDCFPQKATPYSGDRLKYCKGFYKQYLEARDLIIKTISELDVNTIFLTGWSLGGALATILAVDVKFQFGIKPILITYESPNPCCNKKTVNHTYESINLDRSVSFINGDDLVPHVAPFPFARRLKDLDIWIKFNRKGNLVKKPHFNIIKCICNIIGFHVNVDETIAKYFQVKG